MKHSCLAVALSVAAVFLAGPAFVYAQEKDTVIEGQVKIGVHKFKLDSGTLYQFEIKAKDFSPGINLSGAFLQNTADFFKDKNTFRAMYAPPKSQEYTLTVIPNVGFGATPKGGLLDYTVTLKTMKLDETPLLKKEDKLTPQDPKLAQQQIFRKTTFKSYAITMKAGQTYIIDMVASKAAGNKLDPYLYLENSAKNVVAQDDDSGGFPNARIMHRAAQDGEYRIIATGLSNISDTGPFTLTVRTVKGAK